MAGAAVAWASAAPLAEAGVESSGTTLFVVVGAVQRGEPERPETIRVVLSSWRSTSPDQASVLFEMQALVDGTAPIATIQQQIVDHVRIQLASANVLTLGPGDRIVLFGAPVAVSL